MGLFWGFTDLYSYKWRVWGISAIFVVENSNHNELKVEINKIISLIKKENPEILTLFKNWINNLFGNAINNQINDKIDTIMEVKNMFAETLEIDRKNFIKEGKIELREETAIKAIKMGLSLKDISKLTGLSIQKIKKLIK